jgi:N-acetylmuramoyl-L-alanine amidase
LNAGGGSGIEVYQYDNKTDTVAARVLNKICAVTRLQNRSPKKNQNLYVLRHSKPPAILIECGFVDTKTDAEIVTAKTDVIGKAIAEGILGKDINKENQSNQPSKPTSVKPVPSRTPLNRSDILFKKNDKGSAVRILQQDLIKAGYSVGKSGADGVFGPATEHAVRVLQKDYKLSVDGIVGAETRAALSKALEKKKKQPKLPDSAVALYPETLINRGSSGKDVKRIQSALSIHVDGIFGAKTEAAVKAYQKRHNLTADGIVGPQTWNTMF